MHPCVIHKTDGTSLLLQWPTVPNSFSLFSSCNRKIAFRLLTIYSHIYCVQQCIQAWIYTAIVIRYSETRGINEYESLPLCCIAAVVLK